MWFGKNLTVFSKPHPALFSLYFPTICYTPNMPSSKNPKVLAIIGPTASGKTSLSIALAKQFNGEVISADSRQVYRDMDLGTGKVTASEMQGIPHHLIDVADPATIYTGADFKRDAEVALEDIIARKKLPIIAGGTFFYLELLRGTMSTAPVPPDPELRALLETKSTAELQRQLVAADITHSAKIDINNRRRLMRAIEIIHTLRMIPPVESNTSPHDWLTIGIDITTDILATRIHKRILQRIDQGMIEEVEKLHKEGVTWERLDSFGLEYRYIARYLQGTITREIMIEELSAKTRQFAKRQRTWLKRDKSIQWFPFPIIEEDVEIVARKFSES